ncbi:clathrin interactor 1-like [Centruroides sculpturatus]|uniref:clathrin interactor 1-like n=1 Tax=Centruroides sculpturatus TaxID=218467 RepID=UPI000C6E381D|nr:clathrin interactor 1-like [Centruroides sculpturatus]
MWRIREITDRVTNVVMNYTEVEAKVREATNDDAWGPTGQLMQEIAQNTFTYEHFPEVMGMLWKRMLHDNKRNWRRTYKALLLLGYLIRNGSERVVTSAREHIYDLRSLENYTFIDEHGKDQGVNEDWEVEVIGRKKQERAKLRWRKMAAEDLGIRYSDRHESDSWYRRDEFDDFESGKSSNRVPKLSLGRRKSFEDSPEHSNDEEKRSENGDRLEYKDDAEIKLPNKSERSQITPKSTKKIDLGAAANFGKEKSETNSEKIVESSSVTSNSPENKPKSDQTSTDLLSDLVDFGSSSTATNVQTLTANGDFADFTNFQSAVSSPPPSQKMEEFADFSAFSLTSSTTTSNPPSMDLIDSFKTSNIPPLQMQQVVVNNPLQPQSLISHPSMIPSPSGVSTMPMVMQQNIMSMQSPMMSLIQPQMGNIMMMGNHSMMQPPISAHQSVMNNSLKANTWSDAGKVNISVDNLSLASRYEKPIAPSMNQLAAVNNVAMSMQQMTLGQSQIRGGAVGNATVASASVSGMMSPTGMMSQTQSVFSSPGSLGM